MTLTPWEASQIHAVLSNQQVSRVSLSGLSAMMKAREMLSEEFEDEKDFKFSKEQKQYLHKIMSNPAIEWPITEQSVQLAKKIEELNPAAEKV